MTDQQTSFVGEHGTGKLINPTPLTSNSSMLSEEGPEYENANVMGPGLPVRQFTTQRYVITPKDQKIQTSLSVRDTSENDLSVTLHKGKYSTSFIHKLLHIHRPHSNDRDDLSKEEDTNLTSSPSEISPEEKKDKSRKPVPKLFSFLNQKNNIQTSASEQHQGSNEHTDIQESSSSSSSHIDFSGFMVADAPESLGLPKRKSSNAAPSVHGPSPLHSSYRQASTLTADPSSLGPKSAARSLSMTTQPSTHMHEKWKKEEVLGKGANATVILAHSTDPANENLYAIKEFRHKKRAESEKEYVKKVVSEFCISSTLKHPNVVETVDLIQDNDKWCEVMEYMAGGDLYTRISQGELMDSSEIDCYFKQLIHGVVHLHNLGVVHRDLKPENLLLDETRRILKISDFGVAEVFKTCWMKNAKKSKGACGSEPYIAPEEWIDNSEYDPTSVDVWACGIVYYAMVYHTVPWKSAKATDALYSQYLAKRHPEGYGYAPFDKLHEGARLMLYKILDPNPSTRITLQEIVKDSWFQSIDCCLKIDHGKGHLCSVDHLHS